MSEDLEYDEGSDCDGITDAEIEEMQRCSDEDADAFGPTWRGR